MSFNVNDIVRITGLTTTDDLVWVVEPMEELADRNAVGVVVDPDYNDNSVEIYFEDIGERLWFANADVELVNGSTDEIGPVIDSLDIDTVEEGDKVKLINQNSSPRRLDGCESADACGLNLTDDFDILEIDYTDNSVYVEDSESITCWIFASELTVVEEDSVTEDEEETPNFIITNDSVTLSMNGRTEVATIGSTSFEEIRQAVIEGDFDKAHGLMNTSIGITEWGNGSLQIADGVVLYDGMELTGKLVDRVIDMMADGDESFKRFANFLRLTMEQESFKTRNRLMDFAAHDKLDLTDEGYVVAFKNVRDDFFDKHSGTFDNSVGNTLSMRRADVDDNHDNQCSKGLHVCSPSYLAGFWGTSGRTLRVVVNPKNFVAIPYDYNDSKARVCEYTVVEDVTDKVEEYLN